MNDDELAVKILDALAWECPDGRWYALADVSGGRIGCSGANRRVCHVTTTEYPKWYCGCRCHDIADDGIYDEPADDR